MNEPSTVEAGQAYGKYEGADERDERSGVVGHVEAHEPKREIRSDDE
jgi:hypothetical protein